MSINGIIKCLGSDILVVSAGMLNKLRFSIDFFFIACFLSKLSVV